MGPCNKSQVLDRVRDQVVQQLRAAVSISFDNWQRVVNVVDKLNTWKACHAKERHKSNETDVPGLSNGPLSLPLLAFRQRVMTSSMMSSRVQLFYLLEPKINTKRTPTPLLDLYRILGHSHLLVVHQHGPEQRRPWQPYHGNLKPFPPAPPPPSHHETKGT